MVDDAPFYVEASDDPLDLFSTSPTFLRTCADLSQSERCKFGAPFFAFSRGGMRYGVVQGCCNRWECPRCGVQVAKQHYGRIVEGARTVAKEHELWFITITCRGKEITREDALKNYLRWTSKFLDACYTNGKRRGIDWYYVQVTELQRRGHPHSHILSTFAPHDLVEGVKENYVTKSRDGLVVEYDDCLRSDWLQSAVCSAGLGDQYDISKVQTVEGASRYVAKYMFKDSQFSAHFPKRWKRVRYSQSWPKLERQKTDAFVLLSVEDWRHLATLATVVDAPQGDAFETAEYFLRGSDTIVTSLKIDRVSKKEYA